MATRWKVKFDGDECCRNVEPEHKCCPVGSERALSVNYQARGELITIGGDVSCYAVGRGKNAIIVIPDIFGFAGGRIRLIADQLADCGYRCILPKLLPSKDGDEGDGWPGKKDLEKNMDEFLGWIKTFDYGKLGPQINKIKAYLKTKNVEKIGMIGFCWGAWVNFHASAESDDISCCVNCHPSVRLEGLFGSTEVELAKKVKCPQLLCSAGNDPDNVKPGGDVVKALKALPFGNSIIAKEFAEMKHGWVTRGDVENEAIARDVRVAMEMAIDYFSSHLTSRCCPVGSEPKGFSDYIPRGKVITVGGDLPCYSVGAGRNAVLVIPSIWGFAAGRIRLICDQLADQGFAILCPKLLPSEFGEDGDGWDASKPLDVEANMGALMTWLKDFPWGSNIGLQIGKCIAHLDSKQTEKIGMIGFCFGSWVNFHASASGRISCAVNCHPSVRLEGMFGSNEVELAKKVKCPQMLLPAGNDPDNIKPGGEVVKALEGLSCGKEMVVREFPDMTHGWVPRADVTTENGKRDVRLAMEMSIDFLKKHLSLCRCCPPGSEPALASSYVPRGELIKLGDLSCYSIGSGQSAVIVIPDIYGYAGGRMRLIADQLADCGYRVIMPKLLPYDKGEEGDGWPASIPLEGRVAELLKWMGNYPWASQIEPPLFKEVIPFLEKNGCTKIGMIGFCWGGWVNFHASASDKITCAVSCHPSVQMEGMFGSNEVELARKIKCPQVLMPAGGDPDNLKPGGEVVKVLEAASFGKDCVFHPFPEMNHGWVCRGDVSKPEVQRDVKAALEIAINFFGKHL
uniref:Protein AIM2-like n=1 Tax=Hirondellea gigas TaxID=1518452 RepID=A0A2P2I639_9CRUS